MPDLTTEYYWRCRTVEGFEADIPSSDGKRTYPVTMTASERTGEVWNCPCPARISECRHVKDAKEQRCGWDQFLHGGEPAPGLPNLGALDDDVPAVCPECGGRITSAAWAV